MYFGKLQNYRGPNMKVIILGSGAAQGVPIWGWGWGACDPQNPKNYRTRASVFLETEDTKILIDTSPDLRSQALQNDINHVDAVLYTHAHADHCHGINEIQFLAGKQGNPIPIYASKDTIQELEKMFSYAFYKQPDSSPFHKPFLKSNLINGPFQVKDLQIVPFEQDHGFGTTFGFRVKNFAYSTDLIRLDDVAFNILEGVETWVVDCLRYEPSLSHAHLDLTLEWIYRVKPSRAILTHLSYHMDYETLQSQLPEGVLVAYDGMVLEV